KARVLVDFGMFQGRGASDEKNGDLGPVVPARLDAVVLTHAHLDHVGRVPLLKGLGCAIHATHATCDLARLIMEDSAGIQEGDARRENRYRERTGEPPVEPLYTKEDVAKVVPAMKGMGYDEWVDVAPGIRVRMQDAGHILGSASVEMRVQEEGAEKTIVFSGDVGNRDMPILHDPVPCPSADLVIMESTYGDRNHRNAAETLAELKEILKAAAWDKQKVLCPAFAIGRAQLLLHVLAEITRDGTTPEVPIYLDSPLAIRTTEVYERYASQFDDHSRALAESGQAKRDLRNVHALLSSAQSRELNQMWDACVIIAGSGMCDGGRILHHLRHNVWRRGVHIILTSFMGEGTLGRRLVDGANTVRIFREDVAVRAKVHTVGGLSAHAGQSGLLKWLEHAAESKPRLVLVHGEDRQRAALAGVIQARHAIRPVLPKRYDTIDV
ncbi:MAG: MBL fold metallo-hydrolase, partial [Phycisphaerae bacterium]|nr:MBL fold metallo-hydrolase [Phycisphaerae bacterium]